MEYAVLQLQNSVLQMEYAILQFQNSILQMECVVLQLQNSILQMGFSPSAQNYPAAKEET
ncbi:hypothetical protein [Saprospira grandis]|uniref:Uncharacterized protein n=1 Tax=Saprospira grandis (strain Lewin) TaxID=984262 RepID=H6L581_SAPGL|nr:hypothetical protein [Saprospira grandis]AFC23995.1 hypothetical protein SGRA_1260 [Saprospira grandis str. Lewin]